MLELLAVFHFDFRISRWFQIFEWARFHGGELIAEKPRPYPKPRYGRANTDRISASAVSARMNEEFLCSLLPGSRFPFARHENPAKIYSLAVVSTSTRFNALADNFKEHSGETVKSETLLAASERYLPVKMSCCWGFNPVVNILLHENDKRIFKLCGIF